MEITFFALANINDKKESKINMNLHFFFDKLK